MAGEWREVTVAEIASLERNALVGGPFGSNLVSRDYVERGVPVIRGQNMRDRWVGGEFAYVTPAKAESLGANIARPGDIVFTQRGTLGQVCLVPEGAFDRYLISQSQMKLTVDRAVADPMFFYYVFRSEQQQNYIRQHSIQTGVPHTNLAVLRDTPVPLPPVQEQRAIAQLLGTLDDKVELNGRMNETLEAMARGLFKSWFVDFDPVRAKSEGRNPGLPKSLADLFPDSFDESEFGEIPKGWDVGTLADYAELNPESWSKDTAPDEIEYVDLANTKWGKIEATQRHLWQDAPSRAQRILRPGDTIVGTVRPGNGSFAFISESGLTGSTGFAVLRPRMPVHRELVYLAATTQENIERLTHLADGAAYPAVRPDVLVTTQAVRPNHALVERFTLSTGTLMARMAANVKESHTLVALRDTVLPKLISGELRLKDAERFIGGAD
jgi:type I restriction enzyme S subunit